MKRIAINGFGRIGRALFRILEKDKKFQVVAVNDLAHPKILSHLLKYDSVHGVFSESINYSHNSLIINGRKVCVFNEPKIENFLWKDLNIDVVFEASGMFKNKKDISLHIKSGAKKVILCSPPLDHDIPMVVLGVNDHVFSLDDKIISNASCTTNCAAPMIKVLNDAFKLQRAFVTTVHSYTSDQNLHDGIHNDLRRARSAPASIIPTTTGAAKALSYIFPNIDIGGCGIRVPVSNCSLIDITCVIDNSLSEKNVNQLFQIASQEKFQNILHYNIDPIVSIDVKSSPFSCVFDSQLTSVLGDMVKVVGWYDNEYGYSHRLIDLLKKIS